MRNYVAQPIPPTLQTKSCTGAGSPLPLGFLSETRPTATIRDAPRTTRHWDKKNRSKPGKCERRESNPYTQTGNRNLNPARLPISPLSLTKSSAKPPQRQTAAATLYTHALRLMQVFFASPRFLPLFWDALCRCRSIRAFFGGARSMSLALHTSSGAPYRQSRYGTPAATLLPASGQYAPLSPYCLRQYGLSRALCRYRSIRARGAAEAAVAVVKNCCECDEWPLQSSSMDDCMTNAKKSSKEPPVVRVPSCTYSHALHIQSQAPSSLRRPSPVLTTK